MFGKKKKKKIDFLVGHEKLEDLINHLPWPHKKKKKWWPVVTKVLIWVLGLSLLAGIFFAGFLAWRYREVYGLAISGKKAIERSLSSAMSQDFDEMLNSSRDASSNFSRLLKDIRKMRDNFLLKRVALADSELSDLEHLIRALEMVSRSMEKVALIGQEFNSVASGERGGNFTSFSKEEKQRLLKMLYESGPEINGVKAGLELALLEMSLINGKGVLLPLKGQIAEAKGKIKEAALFSGQMSLVSQLLPEISGYPKPSAFLVFFQNHDELRPTGGFLGSYGILEVDSGDIERFSTHDIYHIDMPAEASGRFVVTPPDPIRLYLNKRWYLRDANWSPDWPTSAQKMLWFYRQEEELLPAHDLFSDYKGEFNGVIGITPDLVKSLLAIVGPIEIDGEVYDNVNFTELLEYKVEQDYAKQGISSWDRKDVIGDILEELKIRLFNLPHSSWPTVYEKFSQAALHRDLQVYLDDNYLNGLVKELGMGGEIKESSADYWFAVDANLGARKSDAVVFKSAEYQVRRESDGLYAKLTLNYSHGGKIDWRTDDYKTYTRVYAPAGSRLIKISGIARGKADAWEESGKSVFGAFFNIKAGTSGSAVFEYKLPSRLDDMIKNGEYELYIQKQAGSRLNSVKIDFNAGDRIKSYDIEGAVLKGQNNLIWSSDLSSDKEFSIKF